MKSWDLRIYAGFTYNCFFALSSGWKRFNILKIGKWTMTMNKHWRVILRHPPSSFTIQLTVDDGACESDGGNDDIGIL
jgi:hypothetical protein